MADEVEKVTQELTNQNLSEEQKLEVEEVKHEEIEIQSDVTCWKSIGLSVDQNARHRRRMEDAHVIVEKFGGDNRRGFVGIYDGHGGVQASKYIGDVLHQKFLEEIKNKPDVGFPEQIARAYLATDEQLKEMKMLQQGSTVITCYFAPKTPLVEGVSSSVDEPLVLHTANAGDARAVLCRGGRAIRLSYDHKVGDPAEAARITQCGGLVVLGRVNGILAITRSLGDHSMKECVLGHPHVSEVPLTKEDEFVILACDGLWDVFQDQQAVDLVRDIQSTKKMSSVLLRQAIEAGSTDNISVICVRL